MKPAYVDWAANSLATHHCLCDDCVRQRPERLAEREQFNLVMARALKRASVHNGARKKKPPG